jgi:membrane fusion protein, multidrug efflux system
MRKGPATMRIVSGDTPSAGLALPLVTAVMVLLWAHCAPKNSGPPRPLAVPVLVATAAVMDVPRELGGIGTVEAMKSVAITARVGGQLLRVGFREGQEVSKGDLLFLIDPGPYEAALAQATAALSRDSAAMINAESEAGRYKELIEKEYIAKQEYETAAAVAAEARATVESDRALVKSASLNLGFCRILAPITGRTGNLIVTEGNLITANSPGPLVTINQISPVYVKFALPDARLAEIRRQARQDALAVWAAISQDSLKINDGTLTFIDNTVDQATGTILLKATFPNKDRALWPGQFVRAGLALGKEAGAIVVPSSAIQTSQTGNFVYTVMPGDTVQVSPINTGATWGDMVVIDKGIAVGEKVVVDGAILLRQGAKITVKTGLSPIVSRGAPKK